MAAMRYALLQLDNQLDFVEMPMTHAYQLTALNLRLHKELAKLTAANVPQLPHVIAEFNELEIIDIHHYKIKTGLDYLNELERSFAQIDEKSYPLISLLTEIRALQAQMEQWYEDEAEESQ